MLPTQAYLSVQQSDKSLDLQFTPSGSLEGWELWQIILASKTTLQILQPKNSALSNES